MSSVADSDGTIVPIIDISKGNFNHDMVDTCKKACLEHGFFVVTNHGISSNLIQKHEDIQKVFFLLPTEEKAKIRSDANNRGWTPLREETLDVERSSMGDGKEGLYFGREIPLSDPKSALPLHGPNQWPAESIIAGYREIVEEYIREITQLGFRLLSLLSLSLGYSEDFLHQFFKEPMTFLRPLYYA